jgi:dolichyl-phosphate-mannose--protein O-mannosyl transferase
MLEALVHRVWRVTDVQRRDFYWLTRATAWQAVYVDAHPELITMMDVASLSQDGLSITFKQGTSAVQTYSPIALRFQSALFRGSNTTIRMNSAFQKNRPLRRGLDSGGGVSWTRL